MLQSLSRLQPFPLERSRKGFMDRWKKIRKCDFGDCESEYMREKHCDYTQFYVNHQKDYQEWLVCMWQKRIAWSIFLLNVLPVVYFWFVFNALSDRIFEEALYLPYFALVFWAALGVFGFYRLYHTLICFKWKSLFCDVAAKIQNEGTSFDGLANFVWALFYLVPPIFLLSHIVQDILIWIVFFLVVFFFVIICLSSSAVQKFVKLYLAFICALIYYFVPPLGLLIVPISLKLGLVLFFTNRDRT